MLSYLIVQFQQSRVAVGINKRRGFLGLTRDLGLQCLVLVFASRPQGRAFTSRHLDTQQ